MTKAPDVGTLCAAWRRAVLYPSTESGTAKKTRAELRRADTPLAVLGVAAVHRLYRDLASAQFDLRKRSDGPDRLALLAVAMAHVKDPGGLTAAQQFGAGDPPPLSGIRFDALVRADSPRALIRPLTRALAIIDGRANARALANDLYWWTDRVRANWCFEYYGASDAKPDNPKEDIA